jgi:hypothetical protein
MGSFPWCEDRNLQSTARARWLLLAGAALAASLLLTGAVLAASLLVPDAALGAVTHAAKSASHQSNAAVRWGLLIGIGGATALTVLAALLGPGRPLVVGVDHRISTSKTIATGWTVVVAGALVAMIYADLLNHPQALNATDAAGVIGQYALLFGGPLGAAIAAKGIITSKLANDPAAKTPATSTSVADLVLDDSGNADLGDFQYVLFNLAALVFVLGNLLVHPSDGLPHLPGVLLGLTSVSAAGYIGKKAVTPQGAVTGKLDPEHGTGDTDVEVELKGLTPMPDAGEPMWLRFGDQEGVVCKAAVDRQGVVTLSAKPQVPAEKPRNPVKVTIVTDNGTVIDAGEFSFD